MKSRAFLNTMNANRLWGGHLSPAHASPDRQLHSHRRANIQQQTRAALSQKSVLETCRDIRIRSYTRSPEPWRCRHMQGTRPWTYSMYYATTNGLMSPDNRRTSTNARMATASENTTPCARYVGEAHCDAPDIGNGPARSSLGSFDMPKISWSGLNRMQQLPSWSPFRRRWQQLGH